MNSTDFDRYFDYDHSLHWGEIRSEFSKEFVSLWKGWLGAENYHKLDEVTESDWSKFNSLIQSISQKFELWTADHHRQTLYRVSDLSATLSTYKESRVKEYPQFSLYLIPELGCIITEEWDYTYILWHRQDGSLEKLLPFVTGVGLFNFRS